MEVDGNLLFFELEAGNQNVLKKEKGV